MSFSGQVLFFRNADEIGTSCPLGQAKIRNIEHWSTENFKQHVLDPIVTAVQYLASRHVLYHPTGMPVVTTRGKGFEEELVKKIEDVTGLPATTSIRSAIRALAHLSVHNVAVRDALSAGMHQSACNFSRRAASASSPSTPWTWSSSGCRSHSSGDLLQQSGRGFGTVSGGNLYPVQSVVGRRCGAPDRNGARRAGRDRRPRRLLGGVPFAGHPRPHRRAWPADAQPEQRRQRRSPRRMDEDASAARNDNDNSFDTCVDAHSAVQAWRSRRSARGAGFSITAGPLHRALCGRRQRRPARPAARQQAFQHLGTAGRGRQPGGRPAA